VKGPVVSGFVAKSESDTVGAVSLSDGTELAADLVVVGIGAYPVTGVFNSAGIDIAEKPLGGIVVDSKMRASVPDIWAVGDVAAFPLKRNDGQLVRFEHVDHARRSAAIAVGSMLDPAGSAEYDYLPYFYSRIFEQPGSDRKLWWQFFGSATGDFILVGDFNPKLAAFWISGEGKLNGGFLESGTPEQFASLRSAVEGLISVDSDKLRAASSVDEALGYLG